ncbi:MAG: MoaD/ThiS family protein [Chitinophagales bacterium]
MKVRVLAFGQITDITGRSALELEGIADTNQLVAQMNQRFPLLEKLQYRIAVDKNIIIENTTLENDSVVALLPPFSGG